MKDVLSTSLEALSRYRLRTILSITGIALGIAAVVSMVSVGQGAKAEALRQVSALGLENIVVRYRAPSFAEMQRVRSFGLITGDAGRIARLDSAVAMVSPLREQAVTTIGPAARRDTSVLGVASSFFSILDLAVAHGRPLSAPDDEGIARVCVMGASLAEALFAGEAPVGRTLTIAGQPYVVVGVLAASAPAAGAAAPAGQAGAATVSRGAISPRSFEQAVIVPLGALLAHEAMSDPWQKVDEIWARARPGVNPADAGAAIERTLAAVRPNGQDYEVIVPHELLNQQVRLRRTFDVVVGAIAIVTLLVGGIGVMNVMLMSVFERTSEIGLRRAVGATRRAIAGQFLLEAVAISAAGGVAGLVLGIISATAIQSFGQWPTVLSLSAVVAACLVAIGVGFVSGVYPARRASVLNPIDAVRYE